MRKERTRRGGIASAVAGLGLVAIITGAGAGGLTPSDFAERLASIVPGDQVIRVVEAAGDGDVATTTDELAVLAQGVVAGAAGIAQDIAGSAGSEAIGEGPCPLPPPESATIVDLHQHKAWGGHTLERHVGRTDAQLLQRLDDEPNRRVVSTFEDEATATLVISAALACTRTQLEPWLAQRGRRRRLTCDVPFAVPVGRSLRRGVALPEPARGVTVVYQPAQHASIGYRIFTAYPDPDVRVQSCEG